MGGPTNGWAAIAIFVICLSTIGVAPPASATPWPIQVSSTNNALAAALGAPSSPTATAACVSLVGNQIKVTWTANSLASSYTVLVSTTGSGSGYTTAVTGWTATSWTSGALVLGTYYYEVKTYVGVNWVSVASGPTVGTTIALAACTQL